MGKKTRFFTTPDLLMAFSGGGQLDFEVGEFSAEGKIRKFDRYEGETRDQLVMHILGMHGLYDDQGVCTTNKEKQRVYEATAMECIQEQFPWVKEEYCQQYGDEPLLIDPTNIEQQHEFSAWLNSMAEQYGMWQSVKETDYALIEQKMSELVRQSQDDTPFGFSLN